jgi:hypothetical protein
MNPEAKARNADGTTRAAANACSIELLESRRHFDAAVGGDVTVVMTGLDCPRGLAFDPRGALYVAEAGRGGGVGAPSVIQRGAAFYYGDTGAVSRLWHGRQERVVTGLPSLAMANGSRAEGPSDVSFEGAGSGYVAVGLEGNPNLREQLGVAGAANLGRLVRMTPEGGWASAADLAGYETAANPDGRQVDSDPYSVLAEAGHQIAVDAGGNSLLRVEANGDISTLAVLPTISTLNSGDAVPTCVARGPDGAYYVGILSGLPFADGAARVYRIVPGQAPTEFLAGFKTIIDIDFDPAGNLYVLQHSSGATGVALPGSLLRVAPDGTRTTILAGLTNPTSVVVGPAGDLYVSEFGLSPGGGRVLRVGAPTSDVPVAPVVAPNSSFAAGTTFKSDNDLDELDKLDELLL